MSEQENELGEPLEEPTAEPTESPESDEEDEEASEQPEEPEEPEAAPGEPAEAAAPAAKSVEAQKKAQDKMVRELAKLRVDHAGRVAKIMGEFAPELEECPLCHYFADGWLFMPELEAHGQEIEPVLRSMLGIPEKRDLAPDPDLLLCERCQGKGANSTPSEVNGYDERVCVQCQGKGYIFRTDVLVTQPAGNGAEAQPVTTGPTVFPAETGLPPELEAYRQKGWLVVPPTMPVG